MALSLALSLCVHAGIAGGVVSFFAVRDVIGRLAPWLLTEPTLEEAATEEPRQQPDLAALPTPPLDPVVWIRPGIDAAGNEAPAWIGFKDETEHVAFTATVDQSAMTDELPGMHGDADTIAPPAPAAPPGEPLPAGEPTPPAVSHPVEPSPAPAQPEVAAPPPAVPAPDETPQPPAPEPATRIEPQERPTEDDVRDAEPATAPPPQPPPPEIVIGPQVTPSAADEREGAATEETTEVPVPTEPRPEGPPAPATPAPKPSEEVRPTPPPVKPAEPVTPPDPDSVAPPKPTPPAPAPVPSAPNGTSTPGAPQVPVPAGLPGEQADKEADATSIKEAVDYRAGKVKAGEGIDIKTVRPEFSNYTMITARPRVPIVEITFTTKGKVKNVRLLQSSGYKDVDEPIMNAVWAWSAKGKRLEALAKQNPNATLKISVRMLL